MTSRALNELSLYEAANGIRRGDFTAVELASACIERIDQRESSVHAFESFDADQVMKKAHLLDAEEHAGLLHGIPIGIKDIIDTVEYPCRCGSPIHADRWPRVDASWLLIIFWI